MSRNSHSALKQLKVFVPRSRHKGCVGLNLRRILGVLGGQLLVSDRWAAVKVSEI
jgi:hypothetical protein